MTSLVDRLPPARRARLLSKLSLQEHVSDRNLLAQLGKVAEYLETSDVDETLAVLERAPADFPGRREARSACQALLAMRRYLRNDRDGAFAEWAAVIEEDPEHAAQAYLLRSMVRAVRGELEEALDALVVFRPESAEFRAMRARLRAQEGALEEALNLHKKKLGDMEGAREDLARAAELGWPDALEACEEPT